VTGARKAEILRAVWEGPFDPLRWPAQGVRPGQGRVLWLVDAAAASELLPSQ
jgi:6-phosphogluconolactonase